MFYYLTYLDGIFVALTVASSESYALYYYSKVGLGSLEIGILSTLPILIAALTQLLIPRWANTRIRLNQGLIASIVVQILGLVGIFYSSLANPSFPLILAAITLYWIGGQNAAPLWLDLTCNIIKRAEYARYLGRRNTFIILVTMIAYIFFSYLVRRGYDFSDLFFFGLLMRGVSLLLNILLIKRFHGKSSDGPEPLPTTLPTFQIPSDIVVDSALKAFLRWGSLFRFFVAVSSPFFILYMVRDLDLSVSSYVWLTAIPFLGRALFQPFWAIISRQGFGFQALQISLICASLLPWGWTFSVNFLYLLILQFVSGVVWGGIDLVQLLLIQDHHHGSSRELIGRQNAFFTFFSTIGACYGGWLLMHGMDSFGIFRLSSLGRLLSALILAYHFRQFPISKIGIRKTTQHLVSLLSMRPSFVFLYRLLPPGKRIPSPIIPERPDQAA